MDEFVAWIGSNLMGNNIVEVITYLGRVPSQFCQWKLERVCSQTQLC